ncbi:DUF4390 domain-containing protein [Rhodoferax sp. PAMC 29310]|uniref:DUF4390 domain-containing protein n=1 Tax=Rhodoferax sp. PAMC 29310 TaxID=2822760 RepID=UPI001F0B36E6|nr:DUF4390 domain-containing protein [Rhodoferax sp. PAMC 29310]
MCLVAGVVAPSVAQTSVPEVTQLRVERVDDALVLSARLRFELTDAVEDALLKGVAMIFVVEADISRERWYWSSKRISTVERHMRLIYQPLTRRWRLSVTSGLMTTGGLTMALNQNFDSLQEALSSIQRLSRWKIVDVTALDSDQRYQLDFRFRLDAAQLPRPLQINAFGQSDWDIAVAVNQPLIWESGK